MNKYAVKREVVFAEQYFHGKTIEGVEIIPIDGQEIGLIRLWDSMETINPGDWVIKYKDRTINTCPDKVFKELYEKV